MKEYVLKYDDFLVSQTDTSGRIIFANEDFCNIAGYSLNELVGKPHSIVRHPDMPKAAFKDLWEKAHRGEIWTGYVKNSMKNGGFYWVYATVYPMYDDGKNGGGFISCRRKPSKKEIADAEALYKTMH